MTGKMSRFVVGSGLLSLLGFWVACSESPTAPSRLAQGGSAQSASETLLADGHPASSASTLDPLSLTRAEAAQASCTVSVQKIERRVTGKNEDKEKWVAYTGETVEVVPPEVMRFKVDLDVNIPKKHFVQFSMGSAVLLGNPNVSFKWSPKLENWKPDPLNGELAGKQTVEMILDFPTHVNIPGRPNPVPLVGETLEFNPLWTCYTGFYEEVNSGTVGKLKIKGVKK